MDKQRAKQKKKRRAEREKQNLEVGRICRDILKDKGVKATVKEAFAMSKEMSREREHDITVNAVTIMLYAMKVSENRGILRLADFMKELVRSVMTAKKAERSTKRLCDELEEETGVVIINRDTPECAARFATLRKPEDEDRKYAKELERFVAIEDMKSVWIYGLYLLYFAHGYGKKRLERILGVCVEEGGKVIEDSRRIKELREILRKECFIDISADGSVYIDHDRLDAARKRYRKNEPV